jgi:hypothetical protein
MVEEFKKNIFNTLYLLQGLLLEDFRWSPGLMELTSKSFLTLTPRCFKTLTKATAMA